MAEQKTAASGGIGFAGLLAILFIALKLCHVVTWSWWWILAPIWIPFGIGALILLVALVVWSLDKSK